MMDRLYRHWVYGGFLAGILLLVLTPVLAAQWTLAMLAVFLQLPVYMIHQYEEHDANRFADFVNTVIGGGREVLPAPAVFVINIPGVWGVNALSIWLAATLSLGYGLIGVYLTLVNAIVHIAQAIRMRRYNPGLVTAIVLFVPLAVWSLFTIHGTGDATLFHHLLGLGLAVLLHALIVAYVLSRHGRAQLVSASEAS